LKHIARKIEEYRFVWTAASNRRQRWFLLEVSFVLATSLFGVWNTELRLEHCQMEQLDFPHEIGQKSDNILILQYI